MNFLKKIAEGITMFAIILDESKRINEDGSWDKYHARRNKRK